MIHQTRGNEIPTLIKISRSIQTEHVPKLHLNSLPNDKISDLTKLKAFAEDRIDIAQVMISVFNRIENIVEKGENVGYQHFLPFPHYF